MKRVVIIATVVLVLVAVGAGGWWYVSQNPDVWTTLQDEFVKAVDELGLKPQQQAEGIVASGFVEADQVSVTTEMGGRIVAMHATEGDEVSAGKVLVELDDALLQAQVDIADADLAVAEATMALVKAGVRAETLAHAEAQVAQAEATRAAARVAWIDAQAMLQNPQELKLAITSARTRLDVLNYQTEQAEALANAAQERRNLADEVVSMLHDLAPFLPPDVMHSAQYEQALATYQSWGAWTGAEQAEAALTGADRYLTQLYRQEANPLDLQAQVDTAKAQYEVASAAVGVAQAQVDGLKIGATPEQIAAAEAQVAVARSALAAVQVQMDKLTLKAPISGLVLERPVHVGEVALPGAPLMTLADLDNLTLTIYVPEDQLGKVQLGQLVTVTVDAYPDRAFAGTVDFISSQAEFTPKNVQTQAERVNMVFAVKVRLPNPDHALKPGMPADAMVSEASK
ncbi:MAG: HlyD family secretion protein [Anaerolineae bacterium]|jgi:multidrug resistance efflux pump